VKENIRHSKAFLGAISIGVRKEAAKFLSCREGRLIDIGCGNGLLFKEIGNDRLVYYGLDRSKDLLEESKSLIGSNRVLGIHLIRGDMYSLCFKVGAFDFVTCLNTTMNLNDIGAIDRLFVGCKTLLKNSARFIVDFRNISNPIMRWRYLFNSYLRAFTPRAYSLREIEETLTETGLEIEERKRIRLKWVPMTVAYLLIIKKKTNE